MTPKQVAYAAARIAGAGPSEAYRSAYSVANMSPQAIKVEAARLEKHPTVSLTIATAQREVIDAVTEAVTDTAMDVLRDAIETYRAATEAGQYGAAVSALNLRAKRHPDFSEKHDIRAEVASMIVSEGKL